MAQSRIFAGKTKIKAAIQQRKDADELAELRRVKAEQDAEADRLAEVERIEAAAVAKHEAEVAARAELAKHKAAKVEPVEVSKEESVKRVEARVEEIKKSEPATMPWKGEDKQPKRTALAINTALIQGFCEHGGIEAGQARRILSAIEAGEIVNISINY